VPIKQYWKFQGQNLDPAGAVAGQAGFVQAVLVAQVAKVQVAVAAVVTIGGPGEVSHFVAAPGAGLQVSAVGHSYCTHVVGQVAEGAAVVVVVVPPQYVFPPKNIFPKPKKKLASK